MYESYWVCWGHFRLKLININDFRVRMINNLEECDVEMVLLRLHVSFLK